MKYIFSFTMYNLDNKMSGGINWHSTQIKEIKGDMKTEASKAY